MRLSYGLAAFLAAAVFSNAKATEPSTLSKVVPIHSSIIDDSVVQPAGCTDPCDENSGCNKSSMMKGCDTILPKKSNCNSGCCGNWFDNLTAFSGVEGYKGIGDSTLPPGGGSGFMNSAGFVNGLNTSFRIGQSKIRGQVGGSFGVFDVKGRDTNSRSQSENQGFLTAGVFKRSDVCNDERLAWGVVYDQFWGNQWGLTASDVYLGQFRGILGIAIDPRNEIGLWGTAHTNTDNYAPSTANPTSRLRAVNQYNMYVRHNFDFGGSVMAYAGLVDKQDFGDWTTGLQMVAPLSNNLSIYGNSAFLFPSNSAGAVGSNELLWSISTGLAYSFGGKAVSKSVSGQRCMPLLPVANNGTFFVSTSSL